MNRKKRQQFESLMLPHLDAAYNLARWLSRDVHAAEDIVQTAYIRAFEAFEGYAQGNSAAWILTIVRNTSYTWLDKHKRSNNLVSFDEAAHSHQHDDPVTLPVAALSDPEALAIRSADRTVLFEAIDRLPVEYREALVLREIEGCSYSEIAEITNIPKGTVMSRLSRARKQLQDHLVRELKKEHTGGL